MVMAIKSVEELKPLSDAALAERMSGLKEHTGDFFLCDMELKRRLNKGNEIRGWFSLFISITAVLVSVFALVYGHHA